jgi:hypothetical protein
VCLGKDEVNNPIVDYEQIMRLPNLNFYVRLPGEYPVVRLKLKYRAPKKRQEAGYRAQYPRCAQSGAGEGYSGERARSAAGLTFPTGDEVLEKGSETSSAADTILLRFLLQGIRLVTPSRSGSCRMEEPKPSRAACT